MAADIAGHDDDRVLEIHHPAFIISQSSIIQYLQQYIPNIRMCFFNFIQQHNTIWFASNSFR